MSHKGYGRKVSFEKMVVILKGLGVKNRQP
jgi:hypothetical protein